MIIITVATAIAAAVVVVPFFFDQIEGIQSLHSSLSTNQRQQKRRCQPKNFATLIYYFQFWNMILNNTQSKSSQVY